MSFPIAEAALIARTYGYSVTQGNDGGIFIQRKRDGDAAALIRDDATATIVPYVDDYNCADHLVATALSLAIAPERRA